MTSIALTLGTRASLESLRLTTAAAQETTARLATGRSVNTALDSPSNFFTSQGLNARAAELNQLSDGFTNAIQTLEADANAVKATKDLIEQMQALADEARRNVPPPDEVSAAILNETFTAATDSITAI
ncbi:MAG: flagellar hook protein, partial [Pseudomonadota bacterium]